MRFIVCVYYFVFFFFFFFYSLKEAQDSQMRGVQQKKQPHKNTKGNKTNEQYSDQNTSKKTPTTKNPHEGTPNT